MNRNECRASRFLVLGAARSGLAAARLLKKHGADVIVADSKSSEQAVEAAALLESNGIKAVWGDAAVLEIIPNHDIIVKSPGIPQDNPLVTAAREKGCRVISEIELASAFIPQGDTVVAITGTNGKTTTTAWLAHVLGECGRKVVLAGNIGDAWSRQLLEDNETPDSRTHVVEVSSFQLENLEDFQPDVGILTNITPDHMDRYGDSMERYIQAKAELLKNMGPEQVFVWNAVNESSKVMATLSQSTTRCFDASGLQHAEFVDAWVSDGYIMIRMDDQTVSLMPVNHLPIPGVHNTENALAVILAALSLDVSPEKIAAALKTFPGVEHRIELCGVRPDGVRFYNDSKATNLDAMEKAVQSFDQPITLIAGGRDAHSDYASISHLIRQHVSQLITLGESAPLIEAAWGDCVPTRRAETMADAVKLASELTSEGSVIVFSPACKSFDMYSNFEERGRDFKAKVTELLKQP